MYYWGFDLGDGESTVARASGEGESRPEIVPVDGGEVLLTAWALMKNGEVRIGENAARSAAAALRSAARFKSRFLDEGSDSAGLVRDFSSRVFELLRASGALQGGDSGNRVYIGCPAGWDAAARGRYLKIFENLGLPGPQVISESRAVMVGAVQSNAVRDYIDLRKKSVLVIDVGSSTTDFAFIRHGRESEIRTGGEVALGGGVMDETLLELCVSASKHAAAIRKVFAASESWRVDCELKARRLKERYFSRSPAQREPCVETLLIQYDEPLLLELRLDESMAQRLCDTGCAALGGRSFRSVFCEGLRAVRKALGEEPPELLFLTGGVSRMDELRAWCAQAFPEALLFTDAEPAFSVAKGLAWCGRIDEELLRFRSEVDALIASDFIETLVAGRLRGFYKALLEALLDPLLEQAVKPALIDWRDGKLRRLCDMEAALQEKIKLFLHADSTRRLLLEPLGAWMGEVSEALQDESGAICRRYRVPEQALNIAPQLEAGDLRMLEKLDARQVFAGDALAGAALFAESVLSVIVGLLCGGSGLALIAEGPAGIAIGVVSSLLVLSVWRILGKEAVDEKIMQMDLPLFVRRAALAELLPRIEKPRLGMPAALGGGEGSQGHLLPRLRWPSGGDVPARRMRAIRRKLMESWQGMLDEGGDESVQALSDKLCREISAQIEARLKELAERVEIPL